METIRDCWVEYLELAVPPQASEAQRLETRRAFFAGALSIVHLVDEATDQTVPECDRRLAGVREELLRFQSDVLDGRA